MNYYIGVTGEFNENINTSNDLIRYSSNLVVNTSNDLVLRIEQIESTSNYVENTSSFEKLEERNKIISNDNIERNDNDETILSQE